VFKFWFAFAGRLAGEVEVEEVVTVGVGDAVVVVVVGAGRETKVGEDRMMPGPGRCTPIALLSAGDRGAA